MNRKLVYGGMATAMVVVLASGATLLQVSTSTIVQNPAATEPLDRPQVKREVRRDGLPAAAVVAGDQDEAVIADDDQLAVGTRTGRLEVELDAARHARPPRAVRRWGSPQGIGADPP